MLAWAVSNSESCHIQNIFKMVVCMYSHCVQIAVPDIYALTQAGQVELVF